MKKSQPDAMKRYAKSYSELSAPIFAARFCALTVFLRQVAGKSQLQVARELGVELTEYQTYEESKHLPFRLLARFCKVVGVDADEMFRAVMMRPGVGNQPTVAAVIASGAMRKRRRVSDRV